MKIPETIQIMDSTISIVFDKELACRTDNKGEAHFRYFTMRIQSDTEGKPIKKDSMEQTFFHELTHWILHKLGENDLCDNEKLVDSFASCLTQALRSGKII